MIHWNENFQIQLNPQDLKTIPITKVKIMVKTIVERKRGANKFEESLSSIFNETPYHLGGLFVIEKMHAEMVATFLQ